MSHERTACSRLRVARAQAHSGAGHDPGASLRPRRRLVVVGVVAVCMLAASPAWGCFPGGHHDGHDNQTYIGSCGAPEGSTQVCRPMSISHPFPAATAVKGPPGSGFWAYVVGGPMLNNTPYDLMFASSTLLADGGDCHIHPAVVIGGPTIAKNNGIPHTLGTIPANAPLGRGAVCFTDSPAHTGMTGEGHLLAAHTLAAIFKVVI